MPAVLERKEVWIMHAVLQTNHLCKYYGTGENQVKAVDGISLATLLLWKRIQKARAVLRDRC